MKLYVVEQVNLWGDYGDVLISGFVSRKGSKDLLHLRRTGPFLPPISFPWQDIGGHNRIVSDEFRELLAQRFSGLEFKKAVKSKIVRFKWHLWDRPTGPAIVPEGGEPGDYLDRPHDKKAAAEMPDAWELILPMVPIALSRLKDEDKMLIDEFEVYTDMQAFPDLFADRHRNVIVNNKGKKWLREHAREWVKFCKVTCHPAHK